MTDLSIFDFSTAAPLSLAQAEARQFRINAEEVRERLNQDVRGFVQFLYSGRANIRGRTAYIGNVHGTPGASLSIALAGERAGLWHDFATGEGGDIIDLFLAYRGYDRSDFHLALKEIAKDFLRWDVEIDSAPRVSLRQHIERKKIELGTEPRADHVLLGAPVAKFYYRDLQGNVIASVVRYEPDGTRESKTFRPYHFRLVDGERRWGPGAPEVRPLYRLADIVTHDCVVLCEGEGCADALTSLGIAATSAMQGAEAPIGKTEWHYLAGKTVVIWPDNDPPGRAYAGRVAAHLTLLGCRVLMVQVPASARPKWDAADAVAEQVDCKALIEGAVPFTRANTGLRLYTLEELEHLPPPDWLVSDMIVESSLSMMWAGSDSYKTFVATDMAMSIATGFSWHGHGVKPGLVVYVAAEDAMGVKTRMIGWRETRGQGLARPNVRIFKDGLALVEDSEKLAMLIMELQDEPAFIVIDTVARTFGSGNENQTQDMNSYIRASDTLRGITKSAIMLIHHTGRNEDKERGNVALRAACDTIIAVKRDCNNVTLLNTPPNGKQKNAEPFGDIRLRMQKVSYQSGEIEHSTLLVMPNDDPLPEASDKKPKWGKVQKAIMEAIAGAGRPLGFTSLHAQLGCDKSALSKALAALEEQGVLSSEEPSHEHGARLWGLV